MHSVFLSVSSFDIDFAEAVFRLFPDDWLYLYSKTGRYGAHMWDEIGLEELPKAKVFVVFWSENHPKSSGCVKELIQASALYQYGLIKPVILRLDNYALHWHEGMDVGRKPAFDALKALLDYRASNSNISIEQAGALVAQEIEPLLQSDHPRMPRHDLVQALRGTIQRDRFTIYPASWISGFNGVGRESLVRALCRDFAPNGHGIVVEINETTLPRQLLLRLESEAFGADNKRLRLLNEQTDADDFRAVARAVERIYSAGNFLILRHGRVVHEEVELPDWLDDVACLLEPSTRPKLFIVSQMPFPTERLLRCDKHISAFRVQTIDQFQPLEFCNQLVAFFDLNPTRWQDEDIERIVRVSGGNIGFLVSLVRSAARMPDLDHVDTMLAHEDAKMGDSIANYLRWAFDQLHGYHDEQKTLLFLNDVSPCHISDLEKVVLPQRSMVRILGRLINFGLVERETDDLYRLTPLLANRLNRHLVRPDLVRWADEARRLLATRPFEAESISIEEGHEYIRLEARIQSALLSGIDSLPPSVAAFISAAHWFNASIRLYHAHKWKLAYILLRKVHGLRDQFRDASRIEIDRYFCLVATRMRDYAQSEDCIKRLDNVFRSKPIAAFLQADLHEYKREFPEAIKEYKRALSLNKDKPRRSEYIYRPLIRCFLATKNPNFLDAESTAKKYVALRRTVFSLLSLTRVYLHWKHRGRQAGRDVPNNIDDLYNNALSELANAPGSDAAPFEIYAEEAEFTGDMKQALSNMDQAILMDQERFQLRAERWRIMARSGDRRIAAQAVRELDEAKASPRFGAMWQSYIHSLAETYVRALRTSDQQVGLVNGFAAELQHDGELGRIISRTNRNP